MCNQKAAYNQSEVCVFVWGEETSDLVKEATCAPRGHKNKWIFCVKWYFSFQAILSKTSSVIHKPISRLEFVIVGVKVAIFSEFQVIWPLDKMPSMDLLKASDGANLYIYVYIFE